VHFLRAFRSSARSKAWPSPGTEVPGRLERDAAQPASGQPPRKKGLVGGVDPGGQLTASGGALRVDAIVGHRSADVAGVDPA